MVFLKLNHFSSPNLLGDLYLFFCGRQNRIRTTLLTSSEKNTYIRKRKIFSPYYIHRHGSKLAVFCSQSLCPMSLNSKHPGISLPANESFPITVTSCLSSSSMSNISRSEKCPKVHPFYISVRGKVKLSMTIKCKLISGGFFS